MKKIFILMFAFLATIANALEVGDSIPTFKINDQFEKAQTIKADAKNIIVAGDRDASEVIRDYLLKQEKGFLQKNNSYYVADISGMPSLITKFFALPKMQDYPFSILLVNEEQSKSFTKKEEQITVYSIEDGKVSNKEFIKTAEELDAVFK
ncbi:MAG: hypothetical protein ACQERD_07560 [Campylobacterota bacterium]